MRLKSIVVCLLSLFVGLTSCEPTEVEEDKGTTDTGDNVIGSVSDLTSAEEIKIAETSTYTVYVLTNFQIRNITLEEIPDPATHFAERLAPYRIPTRLEAATLRTLQIGVDTKGQRCLCYDDPKDDIAKGDTQYGTGKYYTFNWGNGAVTKAGTKTKYCIVPIRTEAIVSDTPEPDTPPTDEVLPENPPVSDTTPDNNIPEEDSSQPEEDNNTGEETEPEEDFDINNGIIVGDEEDELIGD